MKGRPLRFLVGATIGWVTLRVAMVWPATAPAIGPTVSPVSTPDRIATLPASSIPAPSIPLPISFAMAATPPRVGPVASPLRFVFAPAPRRTPDPDRIALAMVGLLSPGQPKPDLAPPMLQTMPILGTRAIPAATARRWSASGWLLLRDGGSPAPGLGNGQLGGGQGGFRIAYALGNGRVALFGRVTTPLSGKGREASLGIEWRPTKLPLRLVAEHRFALDGGRGGPGVALVGGTGPARIAGGWTLATYGQAGVIRRDRTEPYADGAARFARPLAKVGKTKVDLGLGAWGGAQRNAARLDVGPTLGVAMPLAGKTIRVSLDWRQRVAGSARPASGPALSIGSDF